MSGPKKAIPYETNELCFHGCGQEAKYINNKGNFVCAEYTNSCPVTRNKNSKAIKNLYDTGKKTCPIPSEARAWRRGRYSAEFIFDGKGSHKHVLIKENGHKCECCGLSEWMNKPITLELEHSDGNKRNNTRENLKLLCPNCHSQTPTWRRKKSSLKSPL